jgi:hypothetical protein
MQILTLYNYPGFGHAIPKYERSQLVDAMENISKEFSKEKIVSELVIVETPEDIIE